MPDGSFTKNHTMNKKMFFLIKCFVWFSVLSLHAQSGEFLEGGFVTLSGERVNGFIQDRPKNSQNDAFYFKSNPEDSPQRYTPQEVSEFFYAPNFKFRSLTVKIDGREEQKFLRQLVSGYAELFEYDDNNPRYLLITPAGGSVQLEKRDSVIAGSRIYRDKRYEGLMKYLLKDCQQLITANNRIEFTQGALSSYVHRYNKCAHPEIPSEVLTTPRRLHVGLGVHGGWNSINMVGNNYNAALPQGKGTGNGFQTGLLVQLSYFNRIALRTGIFYHDYDFTLIGPYSLGEYHYRHAFRSIDIPVNVRYSFSNGKVRPYVYGGIKVPIFLDKTLTTQQIRQGNIESENVTDIEIVQSFIFNAGLGTTLPLPANMEVNLNFGYEQFNAEWANVRTLETNTIVVSAELVF